MNRLRTPLGLLFLAGLLVFVTAGCGGGGGGGGGEPLFLFSGTYVLIGFEGENDTVDTGRAQWGEIIADGAGTVTGGSITDNVNGVLDGPTPQAPVVYVIDAARNLSILSGGVPLLSGRISADGRIATLASVADGTTPVLIILGRKEGAYSNASLSGTYHVALLGYDDDLMRDEVYWGQFTLAGAAGTGTGALTRSADGTLTGPSALGMTYSVAADGSATANLSGLNLSGAVVAGGDLMLLAGATTALSPPFMAVMIKAPAGATNALLNGSYGFTGLRMDESPAIYEWIAANFATSSDGLGTFTFGNGTSNRDGTVTPDVGGPIDYAVAADGTFSIDSGHMEGGVSPTGSFAMVAGDTAGGSMVFYFLLR